MMKLKNDVMAETMEMAEIFKIEMVEGEKRISRWGFFADQGDGTYDIYRPENPVCHIDAMLDEEDGPGAIEIVDAQEIYDFIDAIADELTGIAGMEVNEYTPCGWYFDTIIPMPEAV